MLVPAGAGAQSLAGGTIGGVVRDVSGGVLARGYGRSRQSRAHRKVRTVVTDDQGVYKIVDLRPGAYSVTFTLTGFRPTGVMASS